MRLKLLNLTFFVVLSTLFATIVKTQPVADSSHNLTEILGDNGQSCEYCHLLFQPEGGESPKWNHTPSQVSFYNVYDSRTMDVIPQDLGNIPTAEMNISQICLSCHDGTIAIESRHNFLGGITFVTGDALIGVDLTNDHPVNFIYDTGLAAIDKDLVPPASTNSVDEEGQIPLFAGKLQCSSCHDVHDNTNPPFLVKDNAGSALCLSCHKK